MANEFFRIQTITGNDVGRLFIGPDGFGYCILELHPWPLQIIPKSAEEPWNLIEEETSGNKSRLSQQGLGSSSPCSLDPDSLKRETSCCDGAVI